MTPPTNINTNDPNACVVFMPLTRSGQIHATVSTLKDGKFTIPVRLAICVPPNIEPAVPITTLSQALRHLADHLEWLEMRS